MQETAQWQTHSQDKLDRTEETGNPRRLYATDVAKRVILLAIAPIKKTTASKGHAIGAVSLAIWLVTALTRISRLGKEAVGKIRDSIETIALILKIRAMRSTCEDKGAVAPT